jgi:hypothetical protein
MTLEETAALITDMADRLLDLYAKRDEAVDEGNLYRVHRLKAEINNVAAEREIIRSTKDL